MYRPMTKRAGCGNPDCRRTHWRVEEARACATAYASSPAGREATLNRHFALHQRLWEAQAPQGPGAQFAIPVCKKGEGWAVHEFPNGAEATCQCGAQDTGNDDVGACFPEINRLRWEREEPVDIERYRLAMEAP